MPKADGTGCNDMNACTQTDTCQAGVCTGSNPVICTALDECHDVGVCDTSTGVCSNPQKADNTLCTSDGNPCTSDVCLSGTCSHPAVANGTSCEVGNVCTVGDTCQNGACTPGTVEDRCCGVVCDEGTCNPENGKCVCNLGGLHNGAGCESSSECESCCCVESNGQGDPFVCSNAGNAQVDICV
jgi:hypothetical protein